MLSVFHYCHYRDQWIFLYSKLIGFLFHCDPVDARTQLHNIDNSLREKVNNLRESVEFMNHKHKKYEVDIKMYIDNHLRDKSAIKHLSGILF